VKFIDALEAERQGYEEALELAKTDRIRRRKLQGGVSTVMSDEKQSTSAIAIHRQGVKKLPPCEFIREDVEV
jgi:hypothetical protein